MPIGEGIVAKAIGGVALKAMEKAAEKWVDRWFEQHLPAAKAQAFANVQEFVIELGNRVTRLERSEEGAETRVQESLENPDVAASIEAAVRTASRTDSRERHRVLAGIVAERVRAGAESDRAVASALAIEAISHLSADHLRVLGVLAIVYAGRPPHYNLANHSLGESDWRAAVEKARPLASEYAQWIFDRLAAYEPLPDLSTTLFAHLVASSCIVFERGTARDLEELMLPPTDEPNGHTPFRGAVSVAIRVPRWLEKDWKNLQQAFPTPAGLLIGCVVNDTKFNGVSADEWEWSPVHARDAVKEENAIWDGRRRLTHEFAEAVEEMIRDRVSRGGSFPFGR